MWRLILSAVLALPPTLIQVVLTPFLAVLWLPAIMAVRYSPDHNGRITRGKKKEVSGKDNSNAAATTRRPRHAIVTGGSSGIGSSIAKECVQKRQKDDMPFFTHVTILARNAKRLESARKELQKASDSTTSSSDIHIEALSVDVSDPVALQKAARQIFSASDDETDNSAAAAAADDNAPRSSTTATETDGATTFLFCCAGMAHPGYFHEMPPSQFEHLCRTNQLGLMYTVHAFLPFMSTSSGTIQICSSMAGQAGIFGYTAYTPTKFALRGFAECLHMELFDTNITVQVAYPPDTDTAGYAQENKNKPVETALLSEAGVQLLHPEKVARTMVGAATGPHRPFCVYFDLDGWMLSTLTAGFSPLPAAGAWNLIRDGLVQVTLTSLLRMVALLYLQHFYHLLRTCRRDQEKHATETAAAKEKEIATSSTTQECEMQNSEQE